MSALLESAAMRNGITPVLLQALYSSRFETSCLYVESVIRPNDKALSVRVKVEASDKEIEFTRKFADKSQMKAGDIVVVIPGGNPMVFSEEEFDAVVEAFSNEKGNASIGLDRPF